MKFFFLGILFLFCQAFAQDADLPLRGEMFYPTVKFKTVDRVKNMTDLVRETFTQRYAPKSIKTDEDILKRVAKYDKNPNMKYQDIGWFFETLVKNKFEELNYVKSSTAKLNDLTGKTKDGRFLNAQLKIHKSGKAKVYFKDMLKGYNSAFILPDDHARNLKQYIKNLIRERDYLSKLASISKISDAQQKRLNTLISYNLNSKLHRVKGAGYKYKDIVKKFEKGIEGVKDSIKSQTSRE